MLVAILLGIAAWLAFPIQKTHLGLDLQGGLSVILQAQPTAANPTIDSTEMDQAVKVIQDRVNRLGVAEPEIQRQGTDKISVQLPGIKNPDQALQVIGKTAVLEFFDVSTFGTPYSTEADALKAAGVTSVDKLPKARSSTGPPRRTILPAPTSGSTSRPYLRSTAACSRSASVGYDTNNQPKVVMDFNSEGATAFEQITGKMAETGQITGQTQRLAIVLDGEVASAPTVQEPDRRRQRRDHRQVHSRRGQEPGPGTQHRASSRRSSTRSARAASAPLSARSALNQALIAGAVGLLLVLIFMIAYYRLLGVVASVALIIYGVLFIGILNGIGVTMTLPGIAGMILTLGMAVDANVLIFARMRDEVAAGKTIGAATSAGFKKAFRAVFDCNMTTIITAIILFWAASGSIKGFALTLGIGVALSMFTAVLVTRSMLNLLSGWRPFRTARLLGLHVSAHGGRQDLPLHALQVVVPAHASVPSPCSRSSPSSRSAWTSASISRAAPGWRWGSSRPPPSTRSAPS